MVKTLSVLLIEDDPQECDALARYMELTDDIRLVKATNNADLAIEYVRDYQPDTIILDLELHKGGGNGILFLTALNKEQLAIRPYILVTTNNISHMTHQQVRRLGADFVMVKSQEDYSAESVIGFLRAVKESIFDMHKKRQGFAEVDILSPAEIHGRLVTQVSTEIDLIGISPKAVGRKYLIDAVILLAEEREQNMLSTIAQKYNKSDASVERAMQNAINRAWRMGDIEELQTRYTARINPEKGVPTLTEFIYHYANSLKTHSF
jgi:response regulator of citrate/malate metabolism